MRTFKLSDGYDRIVHHVMTAGHVQPSRQGKTFEVEDTLVLVDGPQALVGFPGYRHGVALTEAAQILSGQYSLDQLERFAPNFAHYSDGYGAYSNRLPAQLPWLLKELETNPDSRRAVLSPWSFIEDLRDLSGRGHEHQHLDHPCTLSLGFRLRKGALNMSVTMRSNDLWLGLPTDFTMFGVLHATLALCLGVEVGTYTHYSHSLHIYHRNQDKIMEWLMSFPNPWDTPEVRPVSAFGTGTLASAASEARKALGGRPCASRSANDLSRLVNDLS